MHVAYRLHCTSRIFTLNVLGLPYVVLVFLAVHQTGRLLRFCFNERVATMYGRWWALLLCTAIVPSLLGRRYSVTYMGCRKPSAQQNLTGKVYKTILLPRVSRFLSSEQSANFSSSQTVSFPFRATGRLSFIHNTLS